MSPQPHPEGMHRYQVLASGMCGVSMTLHVLERSPGAGEDFPKVTVSLQRVKGETIHIFPFLSSLVTQILTKFFQFRSLAKTSAHFPLSSAEKNIPTVLCFPPLDPNVEK